MDKSSTHRGPASRWSTSRCPTCPMPEHAGRVESEAVNGCGRASRSLSACSLPQRKGQILAIQEDRVLAFGAMSEKRLAVFAVSSLGFVAVVLFGFWLALQLAD